MGTRPLVYDYGDVFYDKEGKPQRTVIKVEMYYGYDANITYVHLSGEHAGAIHVIKKESFDKWIRDNKSRKRSNRVFVCSDAILYINRKL